jgi:hypothetical protein
MFDVLEGAWQDLVHRIEAARMLDHVIEAHDLYLQRIIEKCWLLRGDVHQESSLLPPSIDYNFAVSAKRQWKRLLGLINEFCRFQEMHFHEALRAAEVTLERRRMANAQPEEWVFQQEIIEEESFFYLADPSKLDDVIRVSTLFKQGVKTLLDLLLAKVNAPGNSNAELIGA